jgi:hypothetical protein
VTLLCVYVSMYMCCIRMLTCVSLPYVSSWECSNLRSLKVKRYVYHSSILCICRIYSVTYIMPYSRKFSWSPIFVVFADKRLSAKLDPRHKYDCTVYNGHDRTRLRKLNWKDWPSVKIGPHENFPLYSGLIALSSLHGTVICSVVIRPGGSITVSNTSM